MPEAAASAPDMAGDEGGGRLPEVERENPVRGRRRRMPEREAEALEIVRRFVP